MCIRDRDYAKPGFLELGVAPEQAPDTPAYITIHFEKEYILETGSVLRTKGRHAIHCLTVIGQIEGHSLSLIHISLGRMPLVPLLMAVLLLLYGIQGAYQPAVQASIPLLAAPCLLYTSRCV